MSRLFKITNNGQPKTKTINCRKDHYETAIHLCCFVLASLLYSMTTSMVKMKQRGSRRKQSEEDSMEFFEVPSGFEFSKPPSSTQRNNNIAPHTLPPPVTVMTRQPTAKEAALSAKNYRLAKELVSMKIESVHCHCFGLLLSDRISIALCASLFGQSDMRVRHREECQKSSRLTMENVSL